MGARLPGVGGGLAAFWRRELTAAVSRAAGDAPVLDLRSGPYAAAWAAGPRALNVRVLHERRVGDGVQRSVVSHFNKATKGRLVRALATSGALAARRPAQVLTALRDLGWTVVEQPGPADRPRTVDVVVAEL
jgi:hypothetical protein